MPPGGKGKVHYIEVLSDPDEEDDAIQVQDGEHNSAEDEQPRVETEGGTIAALSGGPRFHTFKVRRVVHGCVMILIDDEATHNFIDSALMAKRGIPIEDFEGFSVLVDGGRTMACTQMVPWLTVTVGNYSMTNDFYVVELAETNVVLGVQWLNTPGTIRINVTLIFRK